MAGVDIVRLMQTAQRKTAEKASESSSSSKSAFSSLMQQGSQKTEAAKTKKTETKAATEKESSGLTQTEKNTDTPETSEQTEKLNSAESSDKQTEQAESNPNAGSDSALQEQLQQMLAQWMTMQKLDADTGAEEMLTEKPETELNLSELEALSGAEVKTAGSETDPLQILSQGEDLTKAEVKTAIAGESDRPTLFQSDELTGEEVQAPEGEKTDLMQAVFEQNPAGQTPEPSQKQTKAGQPQAETDSFAQMSAQEIRIGQEEGKAKTNRETLHEEASSESSENAASEHLSGQSAAGAGTKLPEWTDDPLAASTKTMGTVRTTPQTFAQDIGAALARKLPSADGTLELELEPASLGKLTLKLMYEGEKATVSILTTNPKTLELLSQSADEIAQILKERTGQETEIYTPQTEQQQDWTEGRNQENRREPQEQEKKQQDQTQSFAQQLRLGLI